MILLTRLMETPVKEDVIEISDDDAQPAGSGDELYKKWQ